MGSESGVFILYLDEPVTLRNSHVNALRGEFLSSILKCVFVYFLPFKTGSRTCGGGAKGEVGGGGREAGGREQKDGGNERKSKEENQENKNYIQDCTEEEEWDEELKSIYLLFFLWVFVFSKSSFSCPTVQKFFLFKFPSHTSHFLIFYFFLPFFYYYCFVFPFCNNISLREKKKEKIIIYSAVEIMKTDVMNLL